MWFVVQCLCLAPTYELALQIGEVTKQMSKFMGGVRVVFAVRGAEGRPLSLILCCCLFSYGNDHCMNLSNT